MSAVPLYEQALDSLSHGDEVSAAELIKREASDNAELLGKSIQQIPSPEGTPPTEERLQEFLSAQDEANERFVGLGTAIIEYGSPRLLAVLARAVGHVVAPIANTSGSWRSSASYLIGGRVVWALGAFALACDEPQAIASLNHVTIAERDQYGHEISLLAAREFRYPTALGGNAGKSYANYLSWLLERDLVQQRLPLFRANIEPTFAEADLLLALCMIGHTSQSTYSHGVSGSSIRSLSRRFTDPEQRVALASLFEADDKGLPDRVNDCYRRLQLDQRRLWNDEIPETII